MCFSHHAGGVRRRLNTADGLHVSVSLLELLRMMGLLLVNTCMMDKHQSNTVSDPVKRLKRDGEERGRLICSHTQTVIEVLYWE